MSSSAIGWILGALCLLQGGCSFLWPRGALPQLLRPWASMLAGMVVTAVWLVAWLKYFGAKGGAASDPSQIAIPMPGEQYAAPSSAPLVLVACGVALAVAGHLRRKNKGRAAS